MYYKKMGTERKATEMVTFQTIQLAFPISHLFILAGIFENSLCVCVFSRTLKTCQLPFEKATEFTLDFRTSPVQCEAIPERAVMLFTAH